MRSPCKGCGRRCEGCHSKCEAYARYLEGRERLREERRISREIGETISAGYRKRRKERNLP